MTIWQLWYDIVPIYHLGGGENFGTGESFIDASAFIKRNYCQNTDSSDIGDDPGVSLFGDGGSVRVVLVDDDSEDVEVSRSAGVDGHKGVIDGA